jgi:hypothetical protein
MVNRGRATGRVGLAAAFCALVVTRSAAAEVATAPDGGRELRTSSLSWVRLPGAEGCIGTHDLAAAVEARLHRPVIVSAAQADLSIEGRIEPLPHAPASTPPAGAGFRATVVVSSAAGDVLGERTIDHDGADCRGLDETLVLVVAVMIDPEAALEPRPAAAEERPIVVAPELSPTPPEPPEPEVTTRELEIPATTAPDLPSRARTRVDLSAGFVAGLGPVPLPGLGFSISGIVDPPRFWPIEIELGALVATRVEIADADGEALFDRVTGGLMVCAPWERGRVRLQGCLGLQAGALHAAAGGEGFDETHRTWRPLVDPAARVRVLWAVWRSLVLRAGVTLTVPTIRDRFVFEGADGQLHEIFDPWPVGVAFEVGLGVIMQRGWRHSRDG